MAVVSGDEQKFWSFFTVSAHAGNDALAYVYRNGHDRLHIIETPHMLTTIGSAAADDEHFPAAFPEKGILAVARWPTATVAAGRSAILHSTSQPACSVETKNQTNVRGMS